MKLTKPEVDAVIAAVENDIGYYEDLEAEKEAFLEDFFVLEHLKSALNKLEKM